MRLCCVLMAAGAGLRFGENKLLFPFRGAPLIDYALDAIPTARLEAVAVVSRGPILDKARARGFLPIENDDPAAGASRTVRLGTNALRARADALLFMVADQPCLRRESVEALLDFYLAQPSAIACMRSGMRRGNPVIFPGEFFDELCALTGDVGGSAVYKAHPERLREFCIADARELMDADSRAALFTLEARMKEEPCKKS